MALVPKIEIQILNTCNKVDVWEKTGVYSPTNLTGWGSPNIDTTAITSASVKIYNHVGTTLLQTIVLKDTNVNVYNGVASAPTPSAFKALSNNQWLQSDGVFKIVYDVIDSSNNVFTNSLQSELFTCNLCNCMEKIVYKMVGICDEEKLNKLKKIYDQLEMYQYGIKCAFTGCDFTKVDSLLTQANAVCTNFSNCDCGCN